MRRAWTSVHVLPKVLLLVLVAIAAHAVDVREDVVDADHITPSPLTNAPPSSPSAPAPTAAAAASSESASTWPLLASTTPRHTSLRGAAAVSVPHREKTPFSTSASAPDSPAPDDTDDYTFHAHAHEDTDTQQDSTTDRSLRSHKPTTHTAVTGTPTVEDQVSGQWEGDHEDDLRSYNGVFIS